MPTLSELIASADAGDRTAADALFAALYSDLHRLARRQIARDAGGLTLGTTTLLHQAYLEMAGRDASAFPDRARFMAYAARVMRSLIIDHARNRNAQKRGGGAEVGALDSEAMAVAAPPEELSAIGAALDQLAAIDPKLAEVVDLKFFCGFSFAEVAALQGVSERTVQRQWDKARIYLHSVMRDR